MVTSSSLVLTLLTLAAISHHTARAKCIDKTSSSWNNVAETTTESHSMNRAPTATDAVLIADKPSVSVDITEYFTVSLSKGEVLLTPKPALAGVADYPTNANTIEGFCNVTCIDVTEQFSISIAITDADTATPQFAESSYSVDVLENYPVDLAISTLVITASDYDREANNNVVTFSLDGDSTFSLTEAVQTSTSPATFTTQLMLTQSLDWSQNREYRLTVTATDPSGLKTTSDVTVTVADVDNMPPAFKHSGYTAEALDPKAVGPLAVKPEAISATDRDLGGPLKYTLLDLPGAHWAPYFSLDPDTADLSLAKEIPVEVALLPEISLVVEGNETKGNLFSARSVLVVYLTPQPGEDSGNVGYIVGLAVLGCLVLVMAVVAVVLYRRGKRPGAPPTSNSRRDSDRESSPVKRAGQPTHVRSAGLNSTASRESKELSPLAPASPEAYENHSYSPAEGPSASYRLESDQSPEPAPDPETRLYPTLVSETDHGRPISDSHVTSAPPISSQEDDVSATSPPIGGEDAAPPEEPRPDYAAKSVGFKDTVVCVTPVEAVDVLQVDDDDDSDDEDDGHDHEEHDDEQDDGEHGNVEHDEHGEKDEADDKRDDEELDVKDVTKDEDEEEQRKGNNSAGTDEDDKL